VDLFGNVWVGNRGEQGFISGVRHGSVVKIGLVIGGTRCNSDGAANVTGDYLKPPFLYNTAVDRDNDGLIKTSLGLGDIRPWTNVTDGVGGTDNTTTWDARVEDADDECILVFQRTYDAEQVRHVSVDANNDVWVGGYPFAQRSFWKLDGTTGANITSFDARTYGAGGYGGLIDGNGVLWSASISQHTLLRYDTNTNTGSAIAVSNSYGMGIDTNGYIWNSMWTNNSIVKVSPAGAIQGGFPKTTGGSGNDRGVAVTPVDNNVWVANSGGNNVSRLDNAGNVLEVITVGSTPTGVAVDANGKVWVTNLGSHNAMRIDPSTNTTDLTVDLNYIGQQFAAGPYNYSDMTGAVAVGTTSPQGTWTVTYNGTVPDVSWGTISWNSAEPGNSSITVEARAHNSQAGLGGEIFIPVSNGVQFNLTGQYIEIRATLKAGSSPILYDLTVSSNGGPGPGPVVPSVPALTGWGIIAVALIIATLMPLLVKRRSLARRS
jgi:streptogramin lyase